MHICSTAPQQWQKGQVVHVLACYASTSACTSVDDDGVGNDDVQRDHEGINQVINLY